MLATQLRYRVETIPYLNTLYGIDTHHGVRYVGIEAIKNRLAPPGGHMLRHNIDACTHGIPLLDELLHVSFQLWDQVGVAAEKWVLLYQLPIVLLSEQWSQGTQVPPNLHAITLR